MFQYLNGIRGVGKPYNFAYLAYMAIRLIECHRILKETGSLYLHCDPTMSHYLKTTLDCIFGEQNFRREIVWHLRGASGYKALTNDWIRGHDTLLYYAGQNRTFNKAWLPYDEKQLRRFSSVDEHGRRYKSITKTRRMYLDEAKGVPATTVWSDIASFQTVVNSKERTGYPTQKPLALLDRVIKASSNEGDVVLDPFCGCATTCVAAENNGRKWIGIDVSPKAYDLVKERLDREVAHPDALPTYRNEIHLRSNPPRRTDIGASMQKIKDVYIISHPKYSGEYKVGIATNVKARLNSYQIGDPERSYKLEFSHKTHLYRQTEAHIHEHFENKHEWVRADLNDIKQEILSYAGS